MRGAFFGILGARALHRLVFLTELVVQLERTPRGIVLGDDGLERDDHELVALCKQDRDFVRSNYFRSRKAEIIRGYVNKFRTGKVINEGDNLVIVGSPYAMLLHSVGESVDRDTTLLKEDVGIQCFTERFNNGEYLAEFRSPFNSKNNMGCLHNVYDERLKKYFNIGRQCIAINMIGTDFQDRNNG